MADELLSGTVTFLFTDIEGSTQLVRTLRDGYAAVLADHEQLLRDVFAEHGGQVIDTQGDAFFVAFPRALQAVGAAVAAQQALAAHEWPEGGQVRVRMGLHTGEPTVQGGRYTGLGVHRAARICAAGHGGQILLSSATRELVEDELLDGTMLRDLGEQQLKDLPRPENVFQLTAPGLVQDFAPLRSADVEAFSGREGELAEEAAAALAPSWYRRRGVVAGALAGAAAAAVGIAIFALAGGSDEGGGASVSPQSVALVDSSGNVSRAVDIPGNPGAVAVGEGAVWVTDSSTNTVSKVNIGSNEVNDTIRVGDGPTAIAVGGGAVWVANGLDGTVSRIDPATGDATPIQVGNRPAGITYAQGAVWVVNAADRTVSRIDPARNTVVGKPLRADATGPGIAVGSGAVWVTDQGSRTVTRIDSRAASEPVSLPVGNGPTGIAYSGGSLWVANSLDGTVSKVDAATNSISPAVVVGDGPSDVTVAAGSVWVANEFGGTVVQLDPATGRVIDSVRTGGRPAGVAGAADGVWLSVAAGSANHRGGMLRVVSGALDSIDPALAYSPESWAALTLTNDGLVAFRRAGGSEGAQLVPDLATSLPVPTDGGRTYTFRLRTGIHYSDGTPVRASDFRHALERVFALRSTGAPFYAAIVGAEECLKRPRRCDLSRGIVADDAARTATMRLTAPDPEFFFKLALPFAYALPKSVGLAEARTPLPATGPYVIESYQPSGSLHLVRNPRFRPWSHAAQPGGYPNELDWKPAETDVQAVIRGAVDVTLGSVPSEALRTVEVQHPGQLHLNPGANTFAYALNTRVPPFDSLLARRAVNLAVDHDAVTRLLGGADSARPTCQILPPNFPGYQRYCPYGHDVGKAKSLVTRSGTRGAAVTVWTSDGVPGGEPLGRYAVSALRRIGYRASLKVLDPETYFGSVYDRRKRVQMSIAGWFGDYSSSGRFFQPNLGCSGSANASQFCDPEVERGIRRALRVQASETTTAAADLWAEVDRMVVDAAPWVPLANLATVNVVSERVGNFQYNPQWGVLLDQLWVQ